MEKPNKSAFDLDYVGIKASQFSFRGYKADPVLGVDMPLVVGCLGDDFYKSIAYGNAVQVYDSEENGLFSTGPAEGRLIRQRFMKKDIIYMQLGIQKVSRRKWNSSNLVYWPSDNRAPVQLNSFKQRD